MSLLTLFGGTICQPLDNNGNTVPLGKLTFKLTGTGTLKNTFSDAQGLVPHTNPVVLDGNGRATIFLAADAAYDIFFTDKNNVSIWNLVAIIASAPAV